MGLLRRVCILSSCSPTNGISRMGDFRESLLLFNYMSKLDWRRLYLWLQVKSSSWNCGVIVKAKPQQAMSESNLQGNDKAVVKSKATAFPAASSLLSHCSINQSLLNYLLQTKGCISMQVALRFMLANSPWATLLPKEEPVVSDRQIQDLCWLQVGMHGTILWKTVKQCSSWVQLQTY